MEKTLKIIPLPYVRIFTNKDGYIETLCNLNNAPLLWCDMLHSFLTDHRDIDNKDSEDSEDTLKQYDKPINVEFRLHRNFEGRFSCQYPKESHPMDIRYALEVRAKLAVDEAIKGLAVKNI